MQALCEHVEADARNGSLIDLASVLHSLDEEWTRVRTALTEAHATAANASAAPVIAP